MCANPMHEDEYGGSDCPGQGPGCDDDDSVRCSGCDEPLRACACEDETVETAALDVPAVSEAEAVRRQFRDELAGVLERALAYPNYSGQAGTFEGGVESVLLRLCGLSAADVEAIEARAAARRAEGAAMTMAKGRAQ